MMRRDQSFRLPKEVKRLLSSNTSANPHEYKNLMIEAIISGSKEAPREKKKNKHKLVVEIESEE